MITAYLQGGLGNQMFQVAAATALAIENNDAVIFDLKNHHLPLQGNKCKKYTQNVFRKVNFGNLSKIESIYHEPVFEYKKIPYSENLMIHGYFQSEKHFIDHEKEIKDLFSPPGEIEKYISSKYESLLFIEGVTSIHVRRGDYLKFNDTHPLCPSEYYGTCFEELPQDTFYLVFSDDPEWCKNNFKSDRFQIVDEEDYIDLYLMSKCHNNIIANSSFSWWGAWLNNRESKRIFAPKRWFGSSGPTDTNDIIPEAWERR